MYKIKIASAAIREEKEVKGIQIGKEEVKLSLFVDYKISHMEDPKNATRKLLELINEFAKVASYKKVIQINLLHFNTLKEKEIQ